MEDTLFWHHFVLWKGGQPQGWPRSSPNSLGNLVTQYLDILSWITSLYLACYMQGPLPNSRATLPCSLWVLHKFLTYILQTWWFKICWCVTHWSHLRAILLSYAYCLSSCLPGMVCMGLSEVHMTQGTSPTSFITIAWCVAIHITPFLFKHIKLVSPCCLWWHTFDIYWVIPSPWAELVIYPEIW